MKGPPLFARTQPCISAVGGGVARPAPRAPIRRWCSRRPFAGGKRFHPLFSEFAEIDSPAGISDSADFAFSSCSRANFKREPVSGVDIAVTVSLKVLDLDGRLEKSDILSKHLASAFFVGSLQS